MTEGARGILRGAEGPRVRPSIAWAADGWTVDRFPFLLEGACGFLNGSQEPQRSGALSPKG